VYVTLTELIALPTLILFVIDVVIAVLSYIDQNKK